MVTGSRESRQKKRKPPAGNSSPWGVPNKGKGRESETLTFSEKERLRKEKRKSLLSLGGGGEPRRLTCWVLVETKELKKKAAATICTHSEREKEKLRRL